MKKLAKGLLVLALLGLFVAPAGAQTLMTPGTWYTFSFGSPGTDVAATFLIPGSSAMELYVVDCCIIGDRFIAPRHGRLSRRRVLDRALEFLVAD